jgi:hypothetical protein
MALFKYPLWEYPQLWWLMFREAVHAKHVWHTECLLFRGADGREWIQGSAEEHGPSTGAIQRCVCGKWRQVEFATAFASAIDARQSQDGETRLGPKGESAAPQEDAHTPQVDKG